MRAPQRLGPYDVQGLLGRGAMGEVYRARHRDLGAIRAVKVVSGTSSIRAERFLRESRNLARVRHPNVVSVHESGSEGGLLYYAMDLVDGRPLPESMSEERLSLDRALSLAIGICNGVAALHGEGIVHRDLKPENVVLDRGGSPVVLDLGLAIAPELDQRLTQTGAFLGTPWYMAPEQARGERATPRSDVYALGLIAHELASGYAISESGELPGFVLIPLPSSVDGRLPRSLDRVCARALAKDPAERYADAAELAAALEEIRAQPGASRRAVRMSRLALGVAVAIAAVGMIYRLSPPASPTDAPAAARPTGPEPRVEAAALSAADSADRRRAERDLRRIRRLAPRPRHAELREWIDRHADHPALPRARALLRDARLRFPLRELARDPSYTQVSFVGAGRLAFTRLLRPNKAGRLSLLQLEPPKTLRTWDAPERFTALASSPDGRRLAYSGRNGTWLVGAEALDSEPAKISAQIFTRLAFSPDGAKLAGAGPYPEVLVHTLATTGNDAFGPYRGPVNCMAFSPDGHYLVVAAGGGFTERRGTDESLDVWDLRARKAVYRAEAFSRLTSLAFAPSGEYFVVGSAGGLLRRHRLDHKEPGERYVGPGTLNRLQGENASAHETAIYGLAFSSDGALLHSVGPTKRETAGIRRLWDAQSRALLATFEHGSPLRRLALSPDDQRLAIVSEEAVELWEADLPPQLLDEAAPDGPQPREAE